MPQTFQVLRCYKCLAFQVHQTKKSNKFSCKICDEKQSIKRHYGIGIAKDCRMHVQKLNKMRGETDETILGDDCDDYVEPKIQNSTEDTSDATEKRTSKWLSYIDNHIEENYTDIDEIISETNLKNNKRWPRNDKFCNYKAKKNIASKRQHSNDFDETELKENTLNDDNTKNILSKRTLFDNRDDLRVVHKVSKPIYQNDMKLPKTNSEFKEDNLKKFTSLNKTQKFQAPKVNASSKWSQYIERDEDNQEYNCYEAVKNCSKNKQPLFSLCDESDIDDVLDI